MGHRLFIRCLLTMKYYCGRKQLLGSSVAPVLLEQQVANPFDYLLRKKFHYVFLPSSSICQLCAIIKLAASVNWNHDHLWLINCFFSHSSSDVHKSRKTPDISSIYKTWNVENPCQAPDDVADGGAAEWRRTVKLLYRDQTNMSIAFHSYSSSARLS